VFSTDGHTFTDYSDIPDHIDDISGFSRQATGMKAYKDLVRKFVSTALAF
jgi:hypothetical protein